MNNRNAFHISLVVAGFSILAFVLSVHGGATGDQMGVLVISAVLILASIILLPSFWWAAHKEQKEAQELMPPGNNWANSSSETRATQATSQFTNSHRGPRTRIRKIGVVGLVIAFFLFIVFIFIFEAGFNSGGLVSVASYFRVFAPVGYALLLGISSVGLLGVRSWARILTILLSVVAVIFWAWGAYDSFSGNTNDQITGVFAIFFMLPFGYIIWSLSQTRVKEEFNRAHGLKQSSSASEKIVLHYATNWCVILIFINIIWFIGIIQASPVSRLGWSVLLLWQVLYIAVLVLGLLNFWKETPLLWVTLILICIVAADRIALIPLLGEFESGPFAYGKILVGNGGLEGWAWASRYGKCFSLLIMARALIAQLRLVALARPAPQSEIAA